MPEICEIIVPTVWFVLFLFLISNKNFFKSSTISKPILLIGFILKVISALLFGYFFKSGILTGGDTFLYFEDGNIIYNTIKTNPLIYFKLAIGINDYKPVPGYLLPYTDAMHFWFDNSNYFIVRINALLRPFTFGVYNAHAIIFAFISFVGIYNLYLFFENKVINKKILQFILFGVPSIVFWTSGVHKEAIVIFALGTILYNFDLIIKSNYTKRNLFFALSGLVILGYIRLYLLAFLLPLIVAMIIYNKREYKKTILKMFLISICIFLAILFLIDIYTPKISLFQELLVRRAYFLNSPGNMSFRVEEIPQNYHGFLLLLSEAIINPFIRPLPIDCNVFLAYLASIETIILLIILIVLLIKSNLKNIIKNPYAIFSILFGLSTLFLIGLIVNNSGAIVRYRSIAFPFILIGMCLKKNENTPTILTT